MYPDQHCASFKTPSLELYSDNVSEDIFVMCQGKIASELLYDFKIFYYCIVCTCILLLNFYDVVLYIGLFWLKKICTAPSAYTV